MGDGLFWERKCCLSSVKQFPALLGLLLSPSPSSSFFLSFFWGRSWQELGTLAEFYLWVSVPTFEVGSRDQIYFSQLGNGPSKELYPCLTVHIFGILMHIPV